MKLVVVEQVFTVAVIVVQHQELIVFFAYAPTDVHDGVAIQIPALSLNESGRKHPSLVGAQHLNTCLVNTVVALNILVLLTVDIGEPVFAVNHHIWRKINVAGKGKFIPTAVVHLVASVRLVLNHQREFTHKAIFADE
mgnify:CR=1 FL=1